MNKRITSLSILLVTVGLITAASTAGSGVTRFAAEIVHARKGDTIIPRFTIQTDSILAVVGNKIVSKNCGVGRVYMRLWIGSRQIAADTIVVNVDGCETSVPTPPRVASVTVCLDPDPDSMAKYHVSGDTGIDDKLVPCRSQSRTIYLPPAGIRAPFQRLSYGK